MKSKIHQVMGFRIVFAICLASLLLWSAGCDRESDDIPSGVPITVDILLEDGWEFYNDGNYDDAADNFYEAVNAQSDYLEAYLGLGYAYSQMPNNLILAQSNLDMVITFSNLMVADGDTTREYADILIAESYAGMAALELVNQNYGLVIQRVEEVFNLNPDFQHRWIPSLDSRELNVIEAEAEFGSGAYDQCLLTIEALEPGFEQELQQAGIIQVTTDTTEVILNVNPMYSGDAELSLSNSNLIYPVTVEGDLPNGGKTSYEISDYVIGGDMVYIVANPVPEIGDMLEVTYNYAPDFGEFLISLREKLEQL